MFPFLNECVRPAHAKGSCTWLSLLLARRSSHSPTQQNQPQTVLILEFSSQGGGSGTCWTSLSTVSAFSISQAAALKHVCKENHERLQTQSHCKLCRSNCTHTEIFSSAHSALHEHSSSTEQQRGHPVLTLTKATVLLPGRFNTQQKTALLKSQEKFQD